ncbi:MAG TPA: bifunctional riboflavin kinase/FAD synthetase [Acidimicrobiales bacterium]
MIIVRDQDMSATSLEESVVAIGVFDGLHRGHQEVIRRLVSLAKDEGTLATVVTFDPSPAMFFTPTKAPRLIATLEQRLEGLDALGVDQVVVLTFDAALANESAREFIQRVLVGQLRTRGVVVGEDFHFGHQRKGNVALLEEVGAESGFSVHPAPLFGDAERWSSTLVRKALGDGALDVARAILGHPFTLRGVVVHGDERGATLGFRTANLVLPIVQQLPAEGVYAGATSIEGTWWPAAISVGTRPQFYENGDLLVEVHVLGFEGNLYDARLDVVFLARLRDQTTFDDPAALGEQIGRDVAETLQIFENLSPEEFELLG